MKPAIFIVFLLNVFIANSQELSFNFALGDHGWQAEFADYPVGEESFYELKSDNRPSSLSGFGPTAYSGPHILDRWLRCNHITGINPEKDYTDVQKTQTIHL